MNLPEERNVAVVKRKRRGRTPWRRIYSCIEPESLLYPGCRVYPDWDATLNNIRRDYSSTSNIYKEGTNNNGLRESDDVSVNTSCRNKVEDLESAISSGSTNTKPTIRKKYIDADVAIRRRHTVSRIEFASLFPSTSQVTKTAGAKNEHDINQASNSNSERQDGKGNPARSSNCRWAEVPKEKECSRQPTSLDTNFSESTLQFRPSETGFKTMSEEACNNKFEDQPKNEDAAIGEIQDTALQNDHADHHSEVREQTHERNSTGSNVTESEIADVVAYLVDQVDRDRIENSTKSNCGEPSVSRRVHFPINPNRRVSEPVVKLSYYDKAKIFKSHRKNQEPILESVSDGDSFKRLYQLASTLLKKTSKVPITIKDFLSLIEAKGIWLSDNRLEATLRIIEGESDKENTELSEDVFKRICTPASQLVRRVLLGQMTIPGFDVFRRKMTNVCQGVLSELGNMSKEDNQTKDATYDSSSNYIDFMHSRRSHKAKSVSMSVCTVDGQRLSFGDKECLHPMDSCANVLNYCIACRKNGIPAMISRIGKTALLNQEDEFTFDDKGKILNPFTKAGSLMTSAVLLQKDSIVKRVNEIHEAYSKAIANEPLCCDNLTYNLKRTYAHEDMSLAYFLSARRKLGGMCEPEDLLEFHFQSSSTAVTSDSASIAAATIANGGRCPLTDMVVFKHEIILHTLKRMRSHLARGQDGEVEDIHYVYSESGAIFLVIPGVLGLACFMHSYSRRTVGKIVQIMINKLKSEFNFSMYLDLKERTEGKRCCR